MIVLKVIGVSLGLSVWIGLWLAARTKRRQPELREFFRDVMEWARCNR